MMTTDSGRTPRAAEGARAREVEAVIFDCDGVLVDSEVVTMRVAQRVLADLGWEVDLDTLIDMFMGSSFEYYMEQVEKHTGRTLGPDWLVPYRPWYDRAFREELREVTGISRALDRISLPTAVASNSHVERVEFTLKLVGLYERFAGRICSAHDLPAGKPAPDVYLAAADLLNVDPRSCIAVEDSAFGAEAARRAGMRVLAYETELTPAGSFDRGDLVVFSSMDDLPDLIERTRLSAGEVSSAE